MRIQSRLYGTTDLLGKALDASWMRNEVITNNIANVDTPGYKRQNVKFESMLADAMASKRPSVQERILNMEPQVSRDGTNLSYRLDGNNVDIDAEMGYLAENQLRYNALISQVNYNFTRLKDVLRA